MPFCRSATVKREARVIYNNITIILDSLYSGPRTIPILHSGFFLQSGKELTSDCSRLTNSYYRER